MLDFSRFLKTELVCALAYVVYYIRKAQKESTTEDEGLSMSLLAVELDGAQVEMSDLTVS